MRVAVLTGALGRRANVTASSFRMRRNWRNIFGSQAAARGEHEEGCDRVGDRWVRKVRDH